MKISLLIFIISFSISIAQQHSVNIIVETQNIGKDRSVYITGNHSKLGNWEPGIVSLEKKNESIWSIELEVNQGELLEFKFTLGNWSNEALNDDGTIPSNHILLVNNDTIIIYKISEWKDISYSAESSIAGTIHYYRDWKYPELLPRDVLVWLPDVYFTDTILNFPVIYAHDAQNLFDAATSSFNLEWRLDEIADSLIEINVISPFIVVGITSTADRREEYSYGKKGELYAQFIIEELKPYIDRDYRTIPGKENTISLGASMGGLISFILAWEYDNIFGKAACFSPAFKIRSFDYVSVVNKYTGDKKEIELYIDNGGVGLEAELQPGIDKMLETLEKQGYVNGKDFIFFFDKEAEHNEAAWSNRLWRPLLQFFGN